MTNVVRELHVLDMLCTCVTWTLEDKTKLGLTSEYHVQDNAVRHKRIWGKPRQQQCVSDKTCESDAVDTAATSM